MPEQDYVSLLEVHVMPNKSGQVNGKTELEFITEVANDCIAKLKDEDRERLIYNPNAIDYHFSYCLYIRNHYIHNMNFSDVDFWVDPDYLSSEILRMIFSKLIPEYDYDNQFSKDLFDDERFIQLRQEYKSIYGNYPTTMTEEYKAKISIEPLKEISEIQSMDGVDADEEIEGYERNCEKSRVYIDEFLKKLAEKVWRLDNLRQTATECGIDFEKLIPKIQEIQKLLMEEREYIPMEVCLLSYQKSIGPKRYIEYRDRLSKLLEKNPNLMEKLDPSYFDDKVLAKVVLKHTWALGLLPQYQDDETMVRYSLSHNGEAIEHASKRFQNNRDWVKYAIEHSKGGVIMYLDCMKPYRKDEELVYLACKIERWNFVYVDKSYRNDFQLAKLCMEQVGNPNKIYSFMSARLRRNQELAMLDLQEEYPNTEYYSSKLRNDDKIAAELYRLHGNDAWVWEHMSKRLKKKYKIKKL